VDDLAHAQSLCDQLGETFCLTFIKGVDAREALLRMGGYPDTFGDRTIGELSERAQSFDAGYPAMGAALRLGAWSVVIEPGGSLGADHALLESVSRGSTAVSVLRHDEASAHFGYAIDGTTVAGFDPGYPAEETIWGSDPGTLRHLMDALGLRPPDDESDTAWTQAEARAIVLAQRITGVRVPDPADLLRTGWLAAELEPWFVTRARRGDLLRANRRTPYAGDLVAAAEAAAAPVQRAVAVAQARRQATALGVADAPGLAAALDAAAEGKAESVTVESMLGQQVREWLADRKRASALGAERQRMTEAERSHADGLGWFVTALRGVLDEDPRTAVLAALRPLTSGLPALGDDSARAAALRSLSAE